MSKTIVPCSDQQLEEFVEKARMLQIRQYPTPDDVNAETIAGIVSTLCILKLLELALYRILLYIKQSKHEPIVLTS